MMRSKSVTDDAAEQRLGLVEGTRPLLQPLAALTALDRIPDEFEGLEKRRLEAFERASMTREGTAQLEQQVRTWRHLSRGPLTV